MYEFNWSDAMQLALKEAKARKDKKAIERLEKMFKSKELENDSNRSFVRMWYFRSFEAKD